MNKLFVPVVVGVSLAGFVGASARELTLEERVAAQTAIEQVYWRHQVWPAENPGPKPPLSSVMSAAMIQGKVEDYVRKSNALESWWRRPITAEQLQAELDRMARNSKDGATLRELYRALGDDRGLVAETLARPVLVDRLVRNWYAYDTRFHGELKNKAEASRAACASVACMRSMSGVYREVTWKRRLDGDRIRVSDGGTVSLDPEAWSDQLDRLATTFGKSLPVRTLSAVEETSDAFVVTAILAERDGEIVTASVSWPKVGFDAWWAAERGRVGTSIATPAGTYALPSAPSTTCVNDSWSRTRFEAPDRRSEHRAVWTGTEMFVWGGIGPSGKELTGGRYNPATDTWVPVSNGPNAPEAGFYPGMVWTGTEVIIWGGNGNGDLHDVNTGARYNPATDTWTRTSTGPNVPAPRRALEAVWTGTEMLVWGGFDQQDTFFNTGGRYDPSNDTWQPMSVGPNTPQGRFLPTSVWTGTEMIVWGGEVDFETALNTGGRYNPANDTWTATSTGAGCPSARAYHTAVWTGTQMIVWGGEDATETLVNTGGRYNPSTNTWAGTSTGSNVPTGRQLHDAIWTGSSMIVWGGSSSTTPYLNNGGRYNPVNNTWTTVSTGANVPAGRTYVRAVWTGSDMIVWGGSGSNGSLNTGARYTPGSNSWVPTSVGAGVSPRTDPAVVWTGSEMIVWGGDVGVSIGTGGRYRPATDSWAATSGASAPPARRDHGAVWTGTEMIVWGGIAQAASLNTGGRYNPSSDTWTATSIAPGVPAARGGHSTVWTGTQMIVWGGTDNGSLEDFDTGGRYDPSTDAWTATSTSLDTPTARHAHSAVWDGTHMIVWGGIDPANASLDSGALYDPLTDAWTPTAAGSNLPAPRHGHSAAWTGTEMLVWGGTDFADMNTGGRYDPSSGTWSPTSTGANVPEVRHGQSSVWTGEEMIIWGGGGETARLNTGGRYNPATDTWTPTSTGIDVPPARESHGATWTGTQMVIWGGTPSWEQGGQYCACPNGLGVYYRDVDGDGHGNASITQSACSLHAGYATIGDDCNDTDPSVYPGAPELNDGHDNQCPGQPGYGIADEIADTLHVDDGGVVSWTDTSGAASYDVARSSNRSLSPCEIVGSAASGSPTLTDAAVPPPGAVFYYVVRAASPHVGSWGASSAGVERSLSCP